MTATLIMLLTSVAQALRAVADPAHEHITTQ